MRDERTNERQTREDRATQPMDAGWLSFAISVYEIQQLKKKHNLFWVRLISANQQKHLSVSMHLFYPHANPTQNQS